MERIPLGISRLDTIIEGGAPPGSVVLLSGEAGAGSREFMYTSAVMTALARQEHDLFDLHYGDLHPSTALPNEVHYLSFTADEAQIREEIGMAMSDEIAQAGLAGVDITSLTRQYFHLSPVPRSWYAAETRDIHSLGARESNREELLPALGRELSNRAPGNLVVIDSLSDLVGTLGREMEWSDINYLVKGLQRAAHAWQGLLLVHLTQDSLARNQYVQLVDAARGTMEFTWETGGSTRDRTMVVKQFRGVLSQIEDEDIVQFETDLGEAGFDISDVRKIR